MSVVSHEDKVSGVVTKIIYRNNENGYHVLEVKDEETKKLSIVTANNIKIIEGQTMEFIGQWVQNSKYGTQFKSERCFETKPTSKEAMIKYLSSTFFIGIGPILAKRIVEFFGEDTIDIITKDIDSIKKVPGFSKKRVAMIKEAWEKNSEINNIMLFLQQYTISNLFAVKIYNFYGKNCIDTIKNNPYDLCKNITGIGFGYADRIAMDIGFSKESKERVTAGIVHVLSESQSEGHCYLLEEQIMNNVVELLATRNIYDLVVECLKNLVENNEIKRTNTNGENRYYSMELYYSEKYCAQKLALLSQRDFNYEQEYIDQFLQEIEKDDFRLTETQLNYVLQIVKSGVSVLAGSAGTGKTTVLKTVIKLLEILDLKFELCAPTGRAAQRVIEVCGRNAQTIHRLLEYNPSFGFQRNETNPLNINFLVIEESSMVDIILCAHLLRAVPEDCQVLFIGDHKQLPSVGPGNVLHDVMDSNVPNVFVLTEIFRQGKNSLIIEFADNINKGIVPPIPSPFEFPEIWKDGTQCMFVDSDFLQNGREYSEYPQWHSLYYGLDLISMVKKLYIETIKKYYDESVCGDIQILSPMNIGIAGSEAINDAIQEVANPPSEEKKEIKIGSKLFRMGDKVIQCRNNYDIGVFNGQIGKIVDIDTDTRKMQILFMPENSIVEYEKDALLDLKLAYCISVHKSQGSEYQSTIIPITNHSYNLLYRSLLYTAISRGKKLCVFVGQRSALARATKNVDNFKRQTTLKEMLMKSKNLNEEL